MTRMSFLEHALAAGLLLSLAAPVLAQDSAEAQLAQAQAQAAATQAEVLELDRQIDARVAEIVGLLASVQDSTETKTEVLDTKKEAIAPLQKWVQVYARERGRRLGQIQGPGGSAAARADLQNQVAAIDAELNTRVDQIVELAASMSTSEDVKRYESYYADWGVAKVETDEYRANRRQVSRADQTQSGVAEGLEKAIAGLERDIALVPQRLPRDRQQAELDRLNRLLEERRSDLQKLDNAYPSADRRSLGDREADRLEDNLHAAQQDIRALWTQLLAKSNRLAAERQRVRQLQVRAAAPAAEVAPPAPAAAGN